MARKKKEEVPEKDLKTKGNSWTDKNNALQAEKYGGKEK